MKFVYLFIVACAILGVWLIVRKLRHRYIGYGIIYDWDEKTGEVLIASRLTDSPAGEEGIKIGATVLEMDGVPLHFESGMEMESYLVERHRDIQPVAMCTLLIREGAKERETTLVARTIQGPIPVHEPLANLSPQDRLYVHVGMAQCTRTGQLIETRQLNDAAIDEILHPR